MASYHSRWRGAERQIGEQTKSGRGDTGRRDAEKREMIMSKAAVKSDLFGTSVPQYRDHWWGGQGEGLGRYLLRENREMNRRDS